MPYLVICRREGAPGAPWLVLPRVFPDLRAALHAAHEARGKFRLLRFSVERADRITAAAFTK